MKLFSQLLALCICCNIVFCFCGIVDNGWEQAEEIYEQWEQQWRQKETALNSEGYGEEQIEKYSVKEFEYQIAALLQRKEGITYELVSLEWTGEMWKVVIQPEGTKQIQDAQGYFEELLYEEFGLKEEQVEVIVR